MINIRDTGDFGGIGRQKDGERKRETKRRQKDREKKKERERNSIQTQLG